MDGISSQWIYQEGVEEMRQKLLYTSMEFEQFKAEANEELRNKNECVKQLIQLLKTTLQERDEAKNQVQNLLNKVMPIPFTASVNPSEIISNVPQLQAGKPNSSITESNSLSETFNGSSPVDSLFDAVQSPEFTNMNMSDSNNVVFMSQPFDVGVYVDRANLVIDNLVKGKMLPQKGKLLQAMIDTPPLLQSLIVAGPLPKWRNPPMFRPFQIPPFSVKDNDFHTPTANLSQGDSMLLNSQNQVQGSSGSFHILSTPKFTEKRISANENFNDYDLMSKRRRL